MKIESQHQNKPVPKFIKVYLCVLSLMLLFLWGYKYWTTPDFHSGEINGLKISPKPSSLTFQKSTKPSERINKATNLSHFYIYTSRCKIPAIDPFSPDSVSHYTPSIYMECKNDTKDFVTAELNVITGRYVLHMSHDASRKNEFQYAFRCCYIEIMRSESGNNPDNNFKLLPCLDFSDDSLVPDHVLGIIVKCYDYLGEKMYEDGFAFLQSSIIPKVIPPISTAKSSSMKFGVLLIGIDALSRINFRRTMPKTFQYLTESNWLEMRGYNKMGDNTFPNLMAVLTGYNEESANRICKPNEIGGLDKCTFMWEYFRRAGYVTAYAEDQCNIGTFIYDKRGFLKPPTDYYYRPVCCAFERKLRVLYRFKGSRYCVGRRQSADYVFDYCAQLVKKHASDNDSVFGLCWSNSFSHNYYTGPSSYDLKMQKYLKSLINRGAGDRNIIIFFSDHGQRYGPLLKFPAGYLEERLPMFFIWIPKLFRTKYPEFYNNLKLNQYRLTSPYDLYMTLRHLLDLRASGNGVSDLKRRTLAIPPALDCPRCQSLFLPIPEDRTCADAGISEHWCTCNPYMKFNDSVLSKSLARLVIDTMNFYLLEKGFHRSCGKLSLLKVIWTERKFVDDKSNPRADNFIYRIKFQSSYRDLSGYFQATFKYFSETNRMDLSAETISRHDSYFRSSQCIDDKQAKKFCLCKKWGQDKVYNRKGDK